MTRRIALGLAALLALAAGDAAAEISGNVVRIGVLNDQSGPYADQTGAGSVLAARMAVEDFGEVAPGVRVEVVAADHQNKPDVAAEIARRWTDAEGVDALADVGPSSVALAVGEVARARDKALLVSGAGTARLTGDACAPTTVHWTYDTWALAHGTGKAVVATGGTSWFFLTVDYTFGYDLEAQTAEVVKANGGTVLGSVRHPLNTPDFASFLQQAKASGAKVIGLADAGGDTVNAIKQAREFGLVAGGQRLAALLFDLGVADALGLEAAQGLQFVEAFYWDLNDGTRAFSRRFADRFGGRPPHQLQAGVYGAVLHYLKAVRASGTDAGAAVVAKMKELPTDDPCSAKAASARTGARCTRCTCSRSRARRSPRDPGTTTSWCGPSRPRRRSGRSTRAAARWSRRRGRSAERRLRPAQVGRLEALGEPAVEAGEQVASPSCRAAARVHAGERGGGAQFPQPHPVARSHGHGANEGGLGTVEVRLGAGQQQLATKAVQLGLDPAAPGRPDLLEGPREHVAGCRGVGP